MNTNINLLLKQDDESLKQQKKVKLSNFIAVIFLIVTGMTSLIVFLLIQLTDVSSIKKKHLDVAGKISDAQDKQARLFILNDRISNILEILDKRHDLSSVMSSILAKTPNNILVENMEIDYNVISMTVHSNSLFTIGEFINNLTDMVRKKDKINSLTLNSLVFDENKNSYTASIKSEM